MYRYIEFEWRFKDANPNIVCYWPFNYVEYFIKSVIFALKTTKIYMRGVRKGYFDTLYTNDLLVMTDRDGYNVMKIRALDNADSKAYLDKLRLAITDMYDTFIEHEF